MKLLLVLSLASLTLLAGIFASRHRNSSEDSDVHATEQLAANEPSPHAGNRAPVIVELFTSEGCSSCPPADQVLTRLEKEQPAPGAEVIALGQHVDYWNRLGWADPYSSADFSARQGDYARAFGKDGVYTPQMIVDGQAEFVGSNYGRAREAIAQAAGNEKASVRLARVPGASAQADESLKVEISKVPAPSDGDTAEVLLAVTENNLLSSVTRGENAGRELRHSSVVRRLESIGTVDPQRQGAFNATPAIHIPEDWNRANLRAVVFVQERASRRILGAASIALADTPR